MILSPETIAACQQVMDARKGTVEKIVVAVAEATGITPRAIYSTNRKAHIVRARQIVMYEARQHGLTLAQIGHALNRDHTTILHGIRAEETRRAAL